MNLLFSSHRVTACAANVPCSAEVKKDNTTCERDGVKGEGKRVTERERESERARERGERERESRYME